MPEQLNKDYQEQKLEIAERRNKYLSEKLDCFNQEGHLLFNYITEL